MKKTIRIFAFLLLFVWMSVIFIMSAQPADKSSQISGGVVSKLIAALFSKFDALSPNQQANITNFITVVVRKSAHFLEYFVLGLLLQFVLSTFKNLGYKKIFCIAFGVLYAISDEVHQYFVPGRACRLTDVLIDTAGVIVSVALISIILYCKKQKLGEFNAKKEIN